MATQAAPQPSPLKIESLERIPGYDFALRFYSYGKTKSTMLPLIPGLIETAEQGVKKVTSPILENHRSSIEKMDAFACSKIGEVEEIVTRTKSTIQTQFETKALPAVQKSLEVAVAAEAILTSPLRLGLKVVENVVDKVFPEQDSKNLQESPEEKEEEEEEEEETNFRQPTLASLPVPGKELVAAVNQCRFLAAKAQRRSYTLAMTKVMGAKRRTDESVESIKRHSVDLIKYAMDLNENSPILTKARDTCKEATTKIESKLESATETAKKVTTATADYITEHRKLLRSVITDRSDKMTKFVESQTGQMKAFIEKQLSDSKNWEQFVAKLTELKEQALYVRTNLADNKTVVKLTDRALTLYSTFEEFADPYTYNLLKKAREFVTKSKTETTETETETEPEPQTQTDETQTETPVQTETETQTQPIDDDIEDDYSTADEDEDEDEEESDTEDADDANDQGNDQGLVLKITPGRGNSGKGFASDIDDEQLLHD